MNHLISTRSWDHDEQSGDERLLTSLVSALSVEDIILFNFERYTTDASRFKPQLLRMLKITKGAKAARKSRGIGKMRKALASGAFPKRPPPLLDELEPRLLDDIIHAQGHHNDLVILADRQPPISRLAATAFANLSKADCQHPPDDNLVHHMLHVVTAHTSAELFKVLFDAAFFASAHARFLDSVERMKACPAISNEPIAFLMADDMACRLGDPIQFAEMCGQPLRSQPKHNNSLDSL